MFDAIFNTPINVSSDKLSLSYMYEQFNTQYKF